MEKFRSKFVEEANDLIDELEKVLLELESDFENIDLIQQTFRVMHSLKGGSAMFGFNKMDKFTHHLENIYDLIRNGELKLNDDILNITLSSVDHLRNLAKEEDDDAVTHQAQHELLLAKILEVVKTDIVSEASDNSAGEELDGNRTQNSDFSTYYIGFKPKSDIFRFGTNPLYLVDEICELGDTKVYPRFDKLPDFSNLVADDCYVYWDIFLATDQGINAISEVFIFADDQCELVVRKLSDINLLEEAAFSGIIEKTINSGKEIEIDQLLLLTNDLEKVFNKDQKISKEQTTQAIDTNISSIRVSSGKLDNLINWVSELVTIQARLSLFAQETESAELTPIAEEVEKISRRLRDDVFSIRLIPIENMLTRFQRLVRELSQELNKDVAFKTEGTDTELDKNIIESLTDPIMHIIRNSLDHGIEDSETRMKQGKPKRATINVKSFYSGTNVIIQISDDGKGIDPEKIRDKAIMKGLISHDAELSEKECFDLVFMPGFSTAEEVTKVSGRGVGMDVVKRKISEIRGEVDIESVPNSGTTVTIKLPLTLSIIDGLLVSIEDTKFVIPLSSVDKCYEFSHEELSNAVNQLIRTDEKEIAFIDLRDLFGYSGDHPDREHVVVVQYGEVRIGLAVDNIIGQYQAVLKPLGKMYKNQQSVSGATILGDGTVALVLDTNKLISDFANNESKVGG